MKRIEPNGIAKYVSFGFESNKISDEFVTFTNFAVRIVGDQDQNWDPCCS